MIENIIEEKIMKIEILTTGNELLTGKIIDTNTAYLSQELTKQGYSIFHHTTVADTLEDITKALQDAWKRVDIILITGGLGPTLDDVTSEGVCQYFQCKAKFDEPSFESMKQRYLKRFTSLPECNKREAMIPEISKAIPNFQGTAPGFHIEKDNHHLFAMPGVPHEMKAMFQSYVLPFLQQHYALQQPIHKIFRTTGISESSLSETLDHLSWLPSEVAFSFLPEYYGVDLHVTYLPTFDCQDIIQQIYEKIKPFCYAQNMQSIEEVVAQCLIQQKKTIACAESCSGGLLVNRFTNIPGCSAFLKESVVTYSNESKINTLGVTTDTIQKYGAVSKQTAQEVARGTRIKTNSDIGIAITGIAGPTGDTFKKPIGLVYIAYNDKENSIVEKHIFTDNRERHKLRSTQAALYLIYRYVCECSEK